MAAYKLVLAVLATLAVSSALPQQRGAPLSANEPIPILQIDNAGADDKGTYKFSYETGNGIRADESGYVKPLDSRSEDNSEAQVVQGSYSYTGNDGQVYTVTYTADENGFQAQGAHLPTPPPIPEAIQRALDFIASQPQQQQAAPAARG